jgi:transporter family-2 protein
MYYFLTSLAAVLIAVMVAINGGLTDVYGVHLATLIIHCIGLVAATVVALVKKQKLLASLRGLPAALLLGGAIGYFTTLFNNMAVGKISFTALLALSLLGQAATSLAIDQFGFFGMPVRKFNVGKLAGLGFTVGGIVILLWGDTQSAFLPAFVSLLTGLTVVTSRQINAQLSARTGEYAATWCNYVTGTAVAAAALLIAALTGSHIPWGAGVSPRLWIYLGGVVGTVIVLLSNYVTMKMPSLIMTLFMFAGQVFGGVAIDAALYGDFSARTLLGGVCAFLGLVLNVWLDSRGEKKKAQ